MPLSSKAGVRSIQIQFIILIILQFLDLYLQIHYILSKLI